MLPDRSRSVEGRNRAIAAFFALGQTIISRSSTPGVRPGQSAGQDRPRAGLARSDLRHPPGRPAALLPLQRRPAGSHLFRACDGGNQSRSRIDYARGFSSRRIRRTKVSRTRSSGHGNRAPTRDQPREACRGRRAQRRCGAATQRTGWGHLSGKEGARLVTRNDVAGGGAPGAGRRSRCRAFSGRLSFSRGPTYLRPRWTPAGAG
jgi:hypothetical protein